MMNTPMNDSVDGTSGERAKAALCDAREAATPGRDSTLEEQVSHERLDSISWAPRSNRRTASTVNKRMKLRASVEADSVKASLDNAREAASSGSPPTLEEATTTTNRSVSWGPIIPRRVFSRMARFSSRARSAGSRGWPLLRLTRPPRADGELPIGCSFGALRFAHGSSQQQPAKWAAIANDSAADDVTALLTTTWGLRWPDVIISVTGAATDIPEMTHDERLAFQLGLERAVRATKAWVVTGGMDCGVMQLVGQAMAQQVPEERTVCLGVATWVKRSHGIDETTAAHLAQSLLLLAGTAAEVINSLPYVWQGVVQHHEYLEETMGHVYP